MTPTNIGIDQFDEVDRFWTSESILMNASQKEHGDKEGV